MIPVPDVLRDKLAKLPAKPGCYLFRDRNGEIVYVGKAVDLKRRVTSYFSPTRMRRESPKRRGMVRCFADLEWIEARSEAEARIDAQMPTAEKAAKSHYVVANDGSAEDLESAVSEFAGWLAKQQL